MIKSPHLRQEIRRLDMAEWRQELLRIRSPLVAGIVLLGLSFAATRGVETLRVPLLTLAAMLLAWHSWNAYQQSKKQRFRSPKLAGAWKTCEDRLERFQKGVGKLRKAKVADFEEMPKTIDRVAENLYVGLRRADILLREVTESEGTVVSSMMFAPPPHPTQDQVASQLYQIADRNAAEYRQRLNGVLASVDRTEAQSAVFVTTLDTLRMKMLGHRITGDARALTNNEFLGALGEAKLQLEAIDKALDELEINPFGPAPTKPVAPNQIIAEETRQAESDMDEAQLHDQV